MRKWSALFALVYVASLTLAAYGHCWPMLSERMLETAAASSIAAAASPGDHGHHGHDHGAPRHDEGASCASDLVADGVKAQATALDPPQTKSVATHPVIATWAVTFASQTSSPRMRPPDRAAWKAEGYAAIHARTGRLLI